MLGDRLCPVIADGVGIPPGPSQEVLNAIGCGVANLFGELPSVVASGVSEEDADIVNGPFPGFAAGEVGDQSIGDAIEFVGPSGDLGNGARERHGTPSRRSLREAIVGNTAVGLTGC